MGPAKRADKPDKADQAAKRLKETKPDEVSPATRPQVQMATPQEVLEWKDPGHVVGSCLPHLKHLIQYIQSVLPQHTDKPGEALSLLPPLEIHNDKSKQSGWKERWVPHNALTSLERSGVYEAAGSLFWLVPFPQDREFGDVDDWDWALVEEFCDRLSMEHASNGILICPCPFGVYVHADDTGRMKLDSEYPKALNVVRPSLLPVFGYYLALARAVQKGAADHVKALLLSARSVTLQLNLISCGSQVARLGIAWSHDQKLNANMGDTFVSWFLKFTIAIKDYAGLQKDLPSWLEKRKIFYEGKPVNQNVMKAVKFPGFALIQRIFSNDWSLRIFERFLKLPCPVLDFWPLHLHRCAQTFFKDGVFDALITLQRAYGREILTGQYTKLMRLMHCTQNTCKKLGTDPEPEVPRPI